MNNISDNTIGMKLAAFDYFMGYLIDSKCILLVGGIRAESMVRMPALFELWMALGSWAVIPGELVDAAVECMGKFNESQIDSLQIPEFMKSSKKMQNRQCGESVKFALKSLLKSQGRLV